MRFTTAQLPTVMSEVTCFRELTAPGDDTFVDFDSSLRVAVGKLRDALGDDAENPRYVETIPRRGYRFLPPEAYPAFASPVNSSLDESAAAGVRQSAVPSINGHIAPRESPSNRSRRWVIPSLLLVVIAAASVSFRSFVNQKVLTEKDTVILADFKNSTDDPVFDETLRQGLAVQLEQSPFLNMIPQERIRQSLRLMHKSADARLTPELAHEICERTPSAAVLDGSITRLGTQYVLGLRAEDCRSGRVWQRNGRRRREKKMC